MKRSFILRCAKFLASRDAGFLFACVGVLVQAWHSYLTVLSISALEGWQKQVQAMLMALFLSGPLLYFTLKAGDRDEKKAKKYWRLVNTFAIVDAFINTWYYVNKIIIQPWPEAQWINLVIAIPIAWVLPLILQAYGGEVNLFEDENGMKDKKTESFVLPPSQSISIVGKKPAVVKTRYDAPSDADVREKEVAKCPIVNNSALASEFSK